MKWIKLDGKKDPPTSKKVLLNIPLTKKEASEKIESYVEFGYLTAIEFEGDVKQYVFKSGDNEIRNATHFMMIEKPKE
jgi:hypothetical protein